MSLFLFELNELNFDFVQKYLDQEQPLPNFQKIFDQGVYRTVSEKRYENIEPWIQWVSIHTGKKFREHKVFRLGDMAKSEARQIFEEIEARGFNVGAVTPMNAINNLKKPAFFLPDPWTSTHPDNSWTSRWLSSSISQIVNDNAQQKLTVNSIIKLIVAIGYMLPIKDILSLTAFLPWAIKHPWRKAVFLDILLVKVFKTLAEKKKIDFGVIFLNSLAHIQHHYLLSSQVVGKRKISNPKWYVSADLDPFLEALKAYDAYVLPYFLEHRSVICTGLTQVPVKVPEFYYRLKNHKSFFSKLGFRFVDIVPLMTRDFVVIFENNQQRDFFQKEVKELQLDGKPVFGVSDPRDCQLFLSLDYNKEIGPDSLFFKSDKRQNLRIYDEVVFVALKNGIHESSGFVSVSDELPSARHLDGKHVSEIFGYLIALFQRK